MSAVSRSQQAIPTTLLAPVSADPFPCIDNLWSIYAKKGSRTVFLTLGAGISALPDLDLAETLGCPLNYMPIGRQEAWDEVVNCLTTRARTDAQHDFSAGADEKWVLPKHIHRIEALPWWGVGNLDVSGVGTIPTQQFKSVIEGICCRMNLKDGDVRLDILKLDVPEELERPILMAALEAGFRPGIILVRWAKMPNTDIPTTLAAGHLQNCGYSLVRTYDNKFAYYFTDRDVYMSCSWEDSSVPNPLVKDIVDSVQKSLKRPEGGNGHVRFTSPTAIPFGTETAHESVAKATTTGA